jgi:FkbM family methyltransferase
MLHTNLALSGNNGVRPATSAEVRSIPGKYEYHRVGHDRREMELLQDGRIGLGSGGEEQRWFLRRVDGALSLSILGNALTCQLVQDDNGIWRGKWRRHEKMPIELSPIQARSPERNAIDLSNVNGYRKLNGFWVRDSHASQDGDVIAEVYTNDCYWTSVRPSIGDGEVVVDIGAHIGTFAKKWHEKNPLAKIVCVEACPENIEVLKANVGHFAEVIHAACTYETEVILHNSFMENGTATGGSVVTSRADENKCNDHLYWLDMRGLPTITLEQILDKIEEDHIDILKLDCEGSEFNILENTISLEKVRFICGEYHGLDRWDRFRKERFSVGWDYGHMHSAGGLGIFHYARKT